LLEIYLKENIKLSSAFRKLRINKLQIFHETLDINHQKKFPPPPVNAASANLVFAFGSKDCFKATLAAQLCERYPKAQITGCSSSGEIIDGDFKTGALQITAIKFEQDTKVRILNAAFDAENILRIAQYLKAPDLKCVMLLTEGAKTVNGALTNGSIAIKAMREFLPHVPIVGGMASDDNQFIETFLLTNKGILRNSVTAIALYGSKLNVNTTYADGFSVYGPPKTVTKVNKNIVYEINNEPAFKQYKMYIGKHAAANIPPENLRHPLMVLSSTDVRKKLKIRAVLGVQDDALIFGGEINRQATIRMCHTDEEKLIDAVKMAAQKIIKETAPLKINNQALLFCVSCSGRKFVLAEKINQEAQILKKVFPKNTHIFGFYSYGEFCPTIEGINSLHNETITMLHLYESK